MLKLNASHLQIIKVRLVVGLDAKFVLLLRKPTLFKSFGFLNNGTNLASRPTTRRKVLVSSIKGQIWHLDLQQGALLSEDDSHLTLALTK